LASLAALDGLDDVVIARATTDVAFEAFPNFLLGGVWMVFEQLHSRHHHARRTETALKAMTLAEGRLHRMQFALVTEPFDRRDLGALRLHSQDRAGFNGATVHVHGTGAALSGVATHVGSGEMQLVADQLDQEGPGININLNGTPVHGERK